MKARRIITAMLLPAAVLTACSDEDLLNNNAPSIDGKEVVEGFTLQASFATPKVDTRAGFAGNADYIFNNFYFSPEWKIGGSEVVISDNSKLSGDMLGFCLASGTGVNVNLPFYIAGYANTKASEDDKTNIFPLADQTNPLYNLGVTAGASYEVKDDFYGTSKTTKAAFDALLDKVKKGTIAADMDPTKGLFRSNTGVMTGSYIAYYPYNSEFVKPGQIPVTSLEAFQAQEAIAAELTSTAASHYKHIIDNAFAYSKKTVEVSGSSKSTQSGEIKISPLSFIAQIRLYNTSSTQVDDVKLVTVSTADNAADAFVLDGTIKAGSENTFAPGEKKTGIVGVSFPVTDVVGGTTEADYKTKAIMAYLSMYPNNVEGKDLVIKVYREDGKMATFTKTSQSLIAGNAVPKEGATAYWKIDLNGAKWETAERLVYDATSLKAELSACVEGANTLRLLSDVELTGYTLDKATSDINVVGEGKTLTLGAGNTVTAAKSLTFNCNVDVTSRLSISSNIKAGIVINGTTTAKAEMDIRGAFTAKDVKVAAGGSFIVAGGGKDAMVSVNNITVNQKDETTAAGILKIQDSKLTYASITNNGDLTFTDETSILGGKTITNNGTITLTANKKLFSEGNITNNGNIVIPATARFEFNGGKMINAGVIENSGEMVVIKKDIFTNNGSINDIGITYGPGFIEKGANSNYTCAVAGKEALVGAAKINAYTAIKVTAAIADLGESFDANGKKLILAANVTFPAKSGNTVLTHTLSDIEVISNVTLTGKMTATQIIISAGTPKTLLTIGNSSNIVVSGKIITLKDKDKFGDFKYESTAAATRPYVKCADIETNGVSWESYPEYGN